MADGAVKRLNTNNKDWSLIGSLVDSYDFKQEGLVKKTISITLQGVSHHLVSYYKCEDVRKRLFTTPSQHSTLGSITPRAELMTHYFKVPLAGSTSANGTDDHSHGPASMDDGYIIQYEAILMDYHPGLMGLHYTHQQPPLSYMQLKQHEQQQSVMPYYLPYYSEEQQEAS